MAVFFVEAIYFLFTWGNAGIFEAEFRKPNIVTLRYHICWAIVASLPIVLVWLYTRNWVLGLSLVIERFISFPPLINVMRHKKMFFLDGDSSEGSVTDTLEELMFGRFYPFMWTMAVVLFITLQFNLR